MQPLNPAETRNVLVLGTGELGKSVLKSLVTLTAMKVSVMLRPVYENSHDTDKVELAEWLEKLGIEIIYGTQLTTQPKPLQVSSADSIRWSVALVSLQGQAFR